MSGVPLWDTLSFKMVILHRSGAKWDYRAEATELRPIFPDDLRRLLKQAGFASTEFYRDYRLNPYRRQTSGHLVVVAEKERAASMLPERPRACLQAAIDPELSHRARQRRRPGCLETG